MTTRRPATPNSSGPPLRSALISCARLGLLPLVLGRLTAAELAFIASDWTVFGRPDQLPPPAGRDGSPWRTWLVLGGRGAGKTRTGAEWVRGVALGLPPFADRPARRIALVGETLSDAREVMVEGVSGLLAVHARRERPRWEPSRRRLTWPNGAVGQVFSAEDPESLRGPQFDAAWLDELAKWKQAQDAWDMLQFGLRLGDAPRLVATTTPRPVPLLRRLLDDPAVAVSRAATRDNAFNLAPSFLDAVSGRYAGTRLGRQELDGEMVEDRADALWGRARIEASREETHPALARIVVAVDPPVSSGRRADACGIVAAGIDAGGTVHVLEDATLSGVSPAGWGARALALYRRLDADALVVEVNQGGELVETVLRGIDPGVPVTPVRATRSKHLRAEPVAHLYEQGRVRHAGTFPALEDEMCDFGPGPEGYGLTGGRSPDRLDALVWAVTALALTPRAQPRIRVL